ncbi:hypothetical protein [Streptomyces sp. NBC_00046]|uniref:hypothetical protein n=1 Tax=Streptomyces sp. NBC_00046 TaxID=2975626 RepID=UPI00324F3365
MSCGSPRSTPPRGAPEQSEAAESTLGGSVDTAAALPAGPADALRDAAFDAFAREMRIAAVACVVLTAGAAVLIAALLRSTQDTPAPQQPAAARSSPRRIRTAPDWAGGAPRQPHRPQSSPEPYW